MPLHTNRLAAEKSPYLLQHAHNPVDWYPWGEEALRKARDEDKPIFLSIGYSTCHWCHVMERESFEDRETADLLNRHYVAIKVDREERPDIDRVYMTAVQALTGAGGWPLSAWLTPDREPYYAGTYFPPERRYGRPSFRELLEALAKMWREDRDKVLESSGKVTSLLHELAASGTASGTAKEPAPALDQLATALERSYLRLRQAYDADHGGFGEAPKFPRPTVFSFLNRYGWRERQEMALEIVRHSLQAIWAGGIHDHLGGGYHRYSVDRFWRVPHFEKMLYDQAQLAWVFLDQFAITREPFYRHATRDILDYVERELTDRDGAFFSAEDADSAQDAERPGQKTEGAFYLWSLREIEEGLDQKEAAIVVAVHGLAIDGNTIDDPHGDLGHRNVLYAARPLDQVARELGRPLAEVATALDAARRRLFELRASRPRPHRDDKIIVAWNGLMISAFARAGAMLGNSHDVEVARQAAEFALENLVERQDENLLLYRRYRDGERAHAGQLDDYAALALGLVDLHQATGESVWLLRASELVEAALERFSDPSGGFFDSPPDDPTLLVRTKDLYDGAEPSGTALLAHALIRLGRMLHRPEWLERAEAAIRSAERLLAQQPEAAPYLLCALQLLLDPAVTVVVAGDPDATKGLADVVRSSAFDPCRELVVLGGPDDPLRGSVSFYRELIAAGDATARAWLCRDLHCELPIAMPDELAKRLRQVGAGVGTKEGG
jgi:hypothetical protein